MFQSILKGQEILADNSQFKAMRNLILQESLTSAENAPATMHRFSDR
jgi:hypothetical protein